MDHQRETFRNKLELKAVISPQENNLPARSIPGITQDLSKKGCRLLTDPKYAFAGELSGIIRIPSQEQPILFKAKVIWMKPFYQDARHTGLQFTEISESDKTRLESFLGSVFMQTLTFC